MLGYDEPIVTDGNAITELELADWRRRVAKLYADVRFLHADDPVAAWQHWRSEREALYRDHPQSPVLPNERSGFRARHWGYDQRLAFELEVVREEAVASGPGEGGAIAPGPDEAAPGLSAFAPIAILGDPEPGAGSGPLALPTSGCGTMEFRRIGWVDVPFSAGARRLAVYWMAGYAGGLFLPFRDATNGTETYGAGRYLLDGAKSADLGGDQARSTLVLDFNFSYHPSCAFDPKWACPLAPPENRIDVRVEAGERLM